MPDIDAGAHAKRAQQIPAMPLAEWKDWEKEAGWVLTRLRLLQSRMREAILIGLHNANRHLRFSLKVQEVFLLRC